jgi:hypothetical protein
MGEEAMLKAQPHPTAKEIAVKTVLDIQMDRREDILTAIEEALSLIEQRIQTFTGIKPNDTRAIQEGFLCKLERSNEADNRLQDVLDRTNSIRYSLAETL